MFSNLFSELGKRRSKIQGTPEISTIGLNEGTTNMLSPLPLKDKLQSTIDLFDDEDLPEPEQIIRKQSFENLNKKEKILNVVDKLDFENVVTDISDNGKKIKLDLTNLLGHIEGVRVITSDKEAIYYYLNSVDTSNPKNLEAYRFPEFDITDKIHKIYDKNKTYIDRIDLIDNQKEFKIIYSNKIHKF